MNSAASRLRPLLRLCLSAALLGGGFGLAQPGPHPPEAPPRPAAGPRPPQQQAVLTPAQAQIILKRAREVVPRLSLSQATACAGPKRPDGSQCASIILDKQVVGEVLLASDGSLQPQDVLLPHPRPPRSAPTATLSLSALTRANTQLRQSNVSAALRVVGPQVRVTLLQGSRPVAELAFDRQGRLLPVPPGR